MNAHSSPGAYGTGFDGVVLDGVEWETGDVVRLISGGPALTVLSVCDECGSVEVAWFDGASLSVQGLPEEALVYAD